MPRLQRRHEKGLADPHRRHDPHSNSIARASSGASLVLYMIREWARPSALGGRRAELGVVSLLKPCCVREC